MTHSLAPLAPGEFLARVVADHGVACELMSEHGRDRACLLPTTRLDPTGPSRPAAGDWVITARGVGDPPLSIVAILPRRTCMVRQGTGLATREQVIASNIDTVFVVASMNKDLNVNRIERLLAAVQGGGAQAVVVVHKADLDLGAGPAVRHRLAEVEARTPVVFTSVVTEGGLAPLDPFLGPGETVALVGSSGVGKSTLVNHLLGVDAQVTQSQRLDDDRGRHTTVGRALFVMPDGRGVLVDTPGMRELALWSGDGLSEAFADVTDLMTQCRFRSCTHQGEDGCAVAEAITEERLSERRWENHRKLEREAEWMAQRKSRSQRHKGRAFSKHIRSLKKHAW